jgi:hypothetical protein
MKRSKINSPAPDKLTGSWALIAGLQLKGISWFVRPWVGDYKQYKHDTAIWASVRTSPSNAAQLTAFVA